MDRAGGNVGGKRCLPLWMLGVAAADKLRKSDDGDGNNEQDDAPVPKVRQPVSKTRPMESGKDSLLHDKELDKANSRVLKKCETKRKRKSSKKNVDNDRDIPKSDGTVKESAPQKRRRKSFRLRPIQVSEILSQSDDDGELNMEDLMSIANEYVTADKDAEQQQLSNRDCERETDNVSRGSYRRPQTNENVPAHETPASSNNSTDSRINEGCFVSTSRTGDPAQDMLNLYLGPLLKQPLEEKKNPKIFTEDMTFVSEYRNHSQNVAVREELVTSIKKKSSLKDKVAMFLD